MLGTPLSVTRTWMRCAPGPCASLGVHVNTPLAGSILAPGGGETRLKLSVLVGRSASVAVAVSVSVPPSLTTRLAIGLKTGALFTSFTTTVKLFVSLNGGEPVSVTRTVIVLVLGPCASLGVHVNRPVLGWMLAPTAVAEYRL